MWREGLGCNPAESFKESSDLTLFAYRFTIAIYSQTYELVSKIRISNLDFEGGLYYKYNSGLGGGNICDTGGLNNKDEVIWKLTRLLWQLSWQS